MSDGTDKEETYARALGTLRNVARIANVASAPALGAIHTLVEDEEDRRVYQDLLLAAVAAINAHVALNAGREALKRRRDPNAAVSRSAAPSAAVPTAGTVLPLVQMIASSLF